LDCDFIAWPIAATTAFFIMPPARRLTDRIVALIDGRRRRCVCLAFFRNCVARGGDGASRDRAIARAAG
jgi:hypothetical protein